MKLIDFYLFFIKKNATAYVNNIQNFYEKNFDSNI